MESSRKIDAVSLKNWIEQYDIADYGMNWLLRKRLMKKGWTSQSDPSSKNWGMTILTV